ncbi:hypothetical protein DCAR_0311278 [Daucus carota subsp. sativus]|uniref:F-box domain-containing protein n=1 Tax=Daucus carota subsp. sativus TaxID=79200 RepID=A0AAF0WLX7_DAUCS|nr:hypothetical protein DCAR_0311278 [Daucus carota subsp. sativus]
MEKRGNGIERLTNEDLLTEVLSRLRVKWLLRCKAVCKAWLSLISSPSFIKSHIHRVAKQDDDDILIGKISRFEEDDDFQQVNGSFSLIHSRYHHYVAHL